MARYILLEEVDDRILNKRVVYDYLNPIYDDNLNDEDPL